MSEQPKPPDPDAPPDVRLRDLEQSVPPVGSHSSLGQVSDSSPTSPIVTLSCGAADSVQPAFASSAPQPKVESSSSVTVSCEAADSLCISLSSPLRGGSPMDTSEPPATGNVPASEDVDFSHISGFSPTNTAVPAPPASNISGTSKTTSSSYDSSSSSASSTTSPSSADRKAQSDPNLFSIGEQTRMMTMTSSMEQLALTAAAPSTSSRALTSSSSGAPPAKTQRSASGHRRTPTFPSKPSHASPSKPRGGARGRGAPTTRPTTSRPSASSSSAVSPPARRGPTARNPRSRGGRGASRARPSPGDGLPQVATSQLPRETPEGFTHYLISYHPWAEYVNPRPIQLLREQVPSVTTVLDTDTYRHLPPAGYSSLKFNKSLFPQVVMRADRLPHQIAVVELQHLEDTISFRARSQQVIDDLLAGKYVDTDVADIAPTSYTGHPYATIPPLREGIRPVLYQVVSVGWGTGVVLEAKDIFTVGPDRRDLHCIILDQFGIEVLEGGRGFNKPMVSIKDFVWVYDVKPTRQALQAPDHVLRQARIPRTSVLASTSVFFFRAARFAFIAPNNHPGPIYGIILSLVSRRNQVTHARAAFEGCPEAVVFSQHISECPLQDFKPYEIVSARSRVNVSTAMRFSEPPASLEARLKLAHLVRRFLPMHPEEGILPLSVFKISDADGLWLADRLRGFDNYAIDSDASKQQLAKICNAACSALAAVDAADDDRRSHWVTAMVTTPQWFPLRAQFQLTDMAYEAGWGAGRCAALWLTGASHLTRVKVIQVRALTQQKTLDVVVQAFTRNHDSLCRAFNEHGRTVGTDRVADICVRLEKSSTASDPVYELVSHMSLFADLHAFSVGYAVLDIIYGKKPLGTSDETYLQNMPPPADAHGRFTINNRSVTLTADQRDAVRIGAANMPIVAIQAAFGTGKTLVGAVIAALSSADPNTTVIVTTSTNAAVAQFTETLLSLNDFPKLKVVRHISDTAAAENLTPTVVDLSKVLKSLGDTYREQLTEEEQETCADFARYRQLLEGYLEHPDRVPEMSEEAKDEYEIAERFISRTLKRMVRIMFAVHRPSVLCMTTTSLLNSTAGRTGIFTPYIPTFRTVIGDEASQIPEPALLAIVGRLRDARHVYIGDVHQLAPHAKCPRESTPVLHGARSVMSILLQAPALPVAPLVTTFRAHPELVELPNRVAYKGALVSGTPAAARQMLVSIIRFPTPHVPFAFIDLFGESVRAASKSYYNEIEANTCRMVIRELFRKGVPATAICVITFYREQYRRMQEPMAEWGVELTTVDSVQGREKEVVLLLTTRTHFSPDTADFLDDYHRLNVAISRCRQGQFIFGHADSLRKVPTWKRVMEWADSLNAVVPQDTLTRFFGIA